MEEYITASIKGEEAASLIKFVVLNFNITLGLGGGGGGSC